MRFRVSNRQDNHITKGDNTSIMGEIIETIGASVQWVPRFFRNIFVIILFLASLLAIYTMPVNAQTGQDIRFILQTQGGMTAYATLPTAVSLPNARQLFASIEVENDEFVYGDYVLAGRPYRVKLAVGAAGWIIAFHTREYASQHLLDCAIPFDVNQIIGRPERAVIEVSTALGYSDPVVGFYDGRYPEATGIALHWLYMPNTGNLSSTITLPLDNLYLERGYVFCTALTNSEFVLNGEMLERVGSVTQVVRRWNFLGADQLRAGQSNVLEIEAWSIFGTGFLAGVSAVYSGDVWVTAVGGYARTLDLAYPAMLGEPLDISQVYLPFVLR